MSIQQYQLIFIGLISSQVPQPDMALAIYITIG